MAGLMAAALGLGLSWPAPAAAGGLARPVNHEGVALGGYDAVAYALDGAPRAGDPTIVLRWRGVHWHFATPGHRAAFEANPKAYAPAFGGYCPLSVAAGAPHRGDPRHWAIVEQRLVLTASDEALRRLLANPDETLRKARTQWQALRTARPTGN